VGCCFARFAPVLRRAGARAAVLSRVMLCRVRLSRALLSRGGLSGSIPPSVRSGWGEARRADETGRVVRGGRMGRGCEEVVIKLIQPPLDIPLLTYHCFCHQQLCWYYEKRDLFKWLR
jgi:hypothetical protein